eukprot:COSAG02_NODE_12867_length_1479_cov_7.189130_1_plen_406_part_10
MGVGGGAPDPWVEAERHAPATVTGHVVTQGGEFGGTSPSGHVVQAHVVSHAAEQAGYGGSAYVVSENPAFGPTEMEWNRPPVRVNKPRVVKACVALAVAAVVGAAVALIWVADDGSLAEQVAQPPRQGALGNSGDESLTGRPEIPAPLPRCDERTWESVGSVCEDCKVVVTEFRTSWDGKCLNYCGSMGLQCINAWESQIDDTCGSVRTIPCDVDQAVARISANPVDPGGYEDQHGVCRCEPPPANAATVSVSLAVTIEQYEHDPVSFTANFMFCMATTLDVTPDRIEVIAVLGGSVQVDFLILPPAANEVAVQTARGEHVVAVDEALRVLADPQAMARASSALESVGLGEVTVMAVTPPSQSSSCGMQHNDGFVGGSLDGWSSSVGADVLATMTCGGLGEILGGY